MIAKANPEVPMPDETAEPPLDATVVRAAMAAASDQDVVKTFVKLAILADLDDEEIEALRNEAARRSGISRRTIAKMLQESRCELVAKRQYEAQERALAERKLPRPRFDVPDKDTPPLAVMAILDEVIGHSVRDSGGRLTYARKVVLPRTHAFSSLDPEPAQVLWSIRRMSIEACAEMIEQYVEFVDKKGRSVHLPTRFVRHYLETRVR
jgi:hypothetical protein